MVLNSLMGIRGLEPTLAAVESGKDIAFANKEKMCIRDRNRDGNR